MIRWQASVIYRTDQGPVDVVRDIEEIEDLHDLVEAGPHFDTVQEIRIIRVGHLDGDSLTVEQAERL